MLKVEKKVKRGRPSKKQVVVLQFVNGSQNW